MSDKHTLGRDVTLANKQKLAAVKPVQPDLAARQAELLARKTRKPVDDQRAAESIVDDAALLVEEAEAAGAEAAAGAAEGVAAGAAGTGAGAAAAGAAAETGAASGLFGGAVAAVAGAGPVGLAVGGLAVAAAAAGGGGDGAAPVGRAVDTSQITQALDISFIRPASVSGQSFDTAKNVLFTRDGNALIQVSATQEGAELTLKDLKGNVLDTATVTNGVATFRLALNPSQFKNSIDGLVVSGEDLLEPGRVVSRISNFALTVDAVAPTGSLTLGLADAADSALLNTDDRVLSGDDINKLAASPIKLAYAFDGNAADVARLQLFDANNGFELSQAVRPDADDQTIALGNAFLLGEGNNDIVLKAFDSAGNALSSNVIRIEKNTGNARIDFKVLDSVTPDDTQAFIASKQVSVQGSSQALRNQIVEVALTDLETGRELAANQVMLDGFGNFSVALVDRQQKAIDLSQQPSNSFVVTVTQVNTATGLPGSISSSLLLGYVPEIPQFAIEMASVEGVVYNSTRKSGDLSINLNEKTAAPEGLTIRLVKVLQDLDAINPGSIVARLVSSSGTVTPVEINPTGVDFQLSLPTSDLVDGVYTLEVDVKDFLNRSATRRFGLTVDTAAPDEAQISLVQSGAFAGDDVLNKTEIESLLKTGARFNIAKPVDAKILAGDLEIEGQEIDIARLLTTSNGVSTRTMSLAQLSGLTGIDLLSELADGQSFEVAVTLSDAAGNETLTTKRFGIDRSVAGQFDGISSSVDGVSANGVVLTRSINNPDVDVSVDGILNAVELSRANTAVKAVLNEIAKADGVQILRLEMRDLKGVRVAVATVDGEQTDSFLFDNTQLAKLSDGSYTVVALVRDAAGNESEFVVPVGGDGSFVIDKTAIKPDELFVSLGGNSADFADFADDVYVNNAESKNGSLVISAKDIAGLFDIKDGKVFIEGFSASDDTRISLPALNVGRSVDGKSFSIEGIKWDNFKDGKVLVKFVAVDTAGNESLIPLELIKDSAAPQGVITLGNVDSLLKNQALGLSLRVTDLIDPVFDGRLNTAIAIFGKLSNVTADEVTGSRSGTFIESGNAGINAATETFADIASTNADYAVKLRDIAGNERFADGVVSVRVIKAGERTTLSDTDFMFSNLNDKTQSLQATKVIYNLNSTFNEAFANITLSKSDHFIDEGANSSFRTEGLDFGFLQGGNGVDTLKIAEVVAIDFRVIADKVKGVEIFDFTQTTEETEETEDVVKDQLITIDGGSAVKLYQSTLNQPIRIVGDRIDEDVIVSPGTEPSNFEAGVATFEGLGFDALSGGLLADVAGAVAEILAGPEREITTIPVIGSFTSSQSLFQGKDKTEDIIHDKVVFAEKLFNSFTDIVDKGWVKSGETTDGYIIYNYYDSKTDSNSDAVLWVQKELGVQFAS